jgi:hypothetical protein
MGIIVNAQPNTANKLDFLKPKVIGEEVSLTHLVREVDVQPSHRGSSPRDTNLGSYYLKTKSL